MTFMRVDVATSVYVGEISSDSRVRHSIRFLINFQEHTDFFKIPMLN